MRYFGIKWAKQDKYHKLVRNTAVAVNASPDDDIGRVAQSALSMLMNSMGNLKKIEIISIQEYNEKGEEVGLPIVPDEGSDMMPYKREYAR